MASEAAFVGRDGGQPFRRWGWAGGGTGMRGHQTDGPRGNARWLCTGDPGDRTQLRGRFSGAKPVSNVPPRGKEAAPVSAEQTEHPRKAGDPAGGVRTAHFGDRLCPGRRSPGDARGPARLWGVTDTPTGFERPWTCPRRVTS